MPDTSGNAASYFVDRHRDGPVGAKAAFVEAGAGGRTITYQDLALQSDRLGALYERHGLRAEDRAAMLVLDLIEFPVIFWGSLKAGIVPIPLNTLLPAEVYNAILLDSRARALFVSAELLPGGPTYPGPQPIFASGFCDRPRQARRCLLFFFFFLRQALGK